MEVHHHPDLHHKRKKFKEYFLEFLMIFLAVSMGFIAENIREHLSDKAKEKEYIKSFITSIKQDTADLKSIIAYNNIKIKGLDTLLGLARKNMADTANQHALYYYCLNYLNGYTVFKNNDVVMSQLKNAGGFRYIQRDHAADSIAAYDVSATATYTQADVYLRLFKEIENIQEEIFDFTIFTDTSYFKNGVLTGKQIPPFTVDQAKMRLFFNKVISYKLVVNFYSNQLLKSQAAKGERLIAFLTKEYDLSDE